jgi:hypothetical protein
VTQDTAAATAQLKASLRIDDNTQPSTPLRKQHLDHHKKSEILSVTRHSGRAPNSPPKAIHVSEIAHLAGDLFGTPDNPIQPAPKLAPATPLEKPSPNTEVATLTTAPPAVIGQDNMEVDDAKPAALPVTSIQDNQMDVDPLIHINNRIERVRAQLKQLEEAKSPVETTSSRSCVIPVSSSCCSSAKPKPFTIGIPGHGPSSLPGHPRPFPETPIFQQILVAH